MSENFKIRDWLCDRRRVIFVTSAIFYFSSLFCMDSDSKIQALATNYFADLPGFNVLLNSGRDGRFFEMESALYILFNRMSHQDILGFDLAIVFYPNSIPFRLGQEAVLLRTTEFDVVTSNFVIECKSCAVPRGGKSLAQFIKEKQVLKWICWVAHKIKRGKISIKHNFKSDNIDKSIFTLSHFSKKSKFELTLSCSWVTGIDAEVCIESLKKIIFMLAEKKLIVFFRNHASQDFMISLVENQIDFRENVSFLDS